MLSSMRREFIPGWVLLLLIGGISLSASELFVLGGKHPLESSAVAIVLGIILRNFATLPKSLEPGIKTSEKLLIWGVVFIGASLNFAEMSSQSASILCIIAVTMTLGFLVIYYCGVALKLSKTLSILLACGTTICGTSAIAITAPLIKAKDEETSYAVATISLWGLAAILAYPTLAKLVGASELQFGIFAGTAIHSTPQVVGAGFIFSDFAGRTATAIKLVRNCFMAPLAFMVGISFARSARKKGDSLQKISIARAFPWFLFGYFIMAGINTAGYFPKEVVYYLTEFGKFLILLGMAGVGLSTRFSAFKSVGLKPLFVGLLGSLVVAGVSILMIALLS